MNQIRLSRDCERHSSYHDLAFIYEGHTQEVPVRVPDISPQGMFINTPQPLPEGAVLKVRFRLRHVKVEVRTRAEVRYSLPGVGVGVEFIDITPEDRQAIEEELSDNR